jgi:glycosyltransferase involved in cell wall biosynthesis
MNVLFVNNFRSRGGGEEFLMDLLPALAVKGVSVGLLCRPGTPLEEMFAGSQVKVHAVRRSGFAALTSAFELADIIRTNDYQIVNVQRGHDLVQAWAAARLSGTDPRLLYTAHVADFMRSRFLLSRMHHIIAISRFLGDKVASEYPSLARRIRVIHHGIDVSRYSARIPGASGPLRRKFGLRPDAPIIGTVGVIWKNQIEFLDALAEIRKAFPDVRYALAASDKEDAEIRRFRDRAAELGLSDSVLWAGRFKKEEMPQFYADLDLAVSAFRREGFGLWLIEALASGVPVLAFDEGGVRDALEGSPAAVLIRNGAGEMAAEAVKILSDERRRKEMSDAGPRWVAERFSRERMAEDYIRFFRSLTR